MIYAGFKIGTLEMLAIEAATHNTDSTVAYDVWATKLRPLPSGYEYIVVDCAPDLSFLNIALLGMADAIVVPATLDSAGQDAVASFLEYVDPALEATGNPVGRPVWVLPRPSTVGGV